VNHLLPYSYAVGVPDGSDFVVKAMQLAIEKYIDNPQQSGHLPTRTAIVFDETNQFNSVSREEFKKCHRHLLSRTPTISYTILRSTQNRPLQME
jgi:hypothetical protein